MKVVFLHGWGVHTPDYGALPNWLKTHGLKTQALAEPIEIWLSDYISYSDDVTVPDLALAFEAARQALFPHEKFSCVTHSTGGPLMLEWLDRFGREKRP